MALVKKKSRDDKEKRDWDMEYNEWSQRLNSERVNLDLQYGD